MPMSNYGEFKDGISIRGMPLTTRHPGEVFWVNNSGVKEEGVLNGSDQHDGSFRRPMGTLSGAIGKCKAARGDIIMLMPGHAENIALANAIDFTTSGIAVVGLGRGSLIPKFSWTTGAGATIRIPVTTGNNTTFYNCQFEANFADVTEMFNLKAADIEFHHCKFTEAGANLNFVAALGAGNGVNGLVVDHCTFVGSDASNDNCIVGKGTHSDWVITNNRFAFYTAQTAGEGQIEIATDANNFLISDNYFWSTTAAVDNAFVTMAGTGNTGWASRNYLKGVDLDADASNILGAFDVTGLGSFENYAVMDADANAVNFLTDDNLT